MAVIDPAERDTPKTVRDRLADYGGRNQYGRAVWRVILAQRRIVTRAGIFHEFEETGSFEQFTVGANGQVEHKPITPRSVTAGVQETPMYGAEGWILERWFPPAIWGPREQWEELVGQDGVTPIMGPYPAEGDYWMLGGPWTTMPCLDDLMQAIRVYEQERENRPVNFAAAMALHLKHKQDAEERKYQMAVEAIEQYRRSEILPLMKSGSLAAQRVRNQVQAQLGLKSHLGV